MLVAVKAPRIEITMHGDVPKRYIELLKKDYGEAVTIDPEDDDEEEYVDVFKTDWYETTVAERTPGGTLRFYRDLHHLTQKQLAEKLGIASQTISNMETGNRPISRETAYKLGEFFDVPPGRFI